MTVAELLMGSVILPRTESPKAISRLTEFEWFHKMEMENETVTPEIDDLLLRIQKTYQFIEDVIKGLNIPIRVGIMEILFKGTVFKKKKYDVDEIIQEVVKFKAIYWISKDEKEQKMKWSTFKKQLSIIRSK